MIVASRAIEKRSFLNDLLVMDEPEARSRRQFLVRLLGWGGVVGVASSIPDAFAFRATEHETNLLAFTREEGAVLIDAVNLLFPHAGLGPEVYELALADIDARASESQDLQGQLKRLIADVSGGIEGPWQGVSEATRISKLTAVQESSGFWQLRNLTIESLYRNPRVWRLLGYEGSSIEYGGYINRGFDDIDWLDGS